MKETHKKVLGFAGLGLVAAVTTVAATLPAPLAGAIGVTENISVHVSSAVVPDVTLTTTSGSEITSPEYSFKVEYENISKIEVRLLNKNDAGETITSVLLWNADVSTEYGYHEFNLNLDDYGGYGNFLITATGTAEDGVVDTQSLAVKYAETPTPGPEPTPEPTPDPGTDPEVPINPPEETVAKTVVEVKDANGNVVKTIEINDPSDVEKIDLSDLPNGSYTLDIISTDADGTTIKEETKTAVVNKTSEDVKIQDQGEDIKQVIINVTDENGDVVKTIVVDNPVPGENVNVDLSDLPTGNYDINVEYINDNDETIGEETVPTTTEEKVPIKIEDKGEEIGQAVINVTDKDGHVIKTIVLENPEAGDTTNVDISDLTPGSYNINVEYYDDHGNKIGSDNIPVIKTEDDGSADVDIENKVNTVTTIEATIYDKDGKIVRVVKADRATGTVYVYDANGNLINTIPNGYEEGKELAIPFEGLEDGDYKTVITYKNANGKIVGDAETYNISYDDGKSIVVPDTGGLFQGLNISREDYLITGLIVFMVVGVVAFGIVVKNKRSKTSNKKNRR